MASRDKKDLNPTLVQAYDMACVEFKRLFPNDPQPFITCTYRSDEEQNALYEQGVKDPAHKVTNAKGGESPHNYNPSFAFDIGFITNDKKMDWTPSLFKKFATCIENISSVVEWGGGWVHMPDAPHFQLKNYKSLIKSMP